MTAPATVSWIGYGWETSYAATATSINKAFGQGVRVTSLSRKNNIEKVFSMGSRNAQKLAAKRYEGAVSIEHVLANPWIFQGILGSVTSTAAGTAYDHTFAEADTIPSFTMDNNIQTSAVRRAQLLGSVVNSATITTAINELVRVRLDIPFGDEDFATSSSSKLTESEDIYTFAQGSIEAPNGSTLALVQNFEATLSNSAELILGQGSRFAQEQAPKQRDYDGTMTMALQASVDLLEKFYGSATGPNATVDETATMQTTFTNGLTGTNERTIEATWTGVQFDEDSMPQDPTQVIMEDVNFMMRSLSVVATNHTSAAP